MIRLSAFADEISANLDEQIDVLQSENIHFIDFRAAWGINILDLSDEQITEAKRRLDAAGIGVAAIATPIGKVPIDSSFDTLMQRFARAVTVARALNSSYIRIFSFYPPADAQSGTSDPASYRDEVLRRLGELTARARTAGLILVHENERGIYGDTIARCVDLLESINDPHFRSAFDPANYLQSSQTPYPDGYEATHPWLEYVHVKDVRHDGTLTVAGDGEALWADTLQRLRGDGYDGFLALEPHLTMAAQYQGFSGPDLFRKASQALQKLLRDMNWTYA